MTRTNLPKILLIAIHIQGDNIEIKCYFCSSRYVDFVIFIIMPAIFPGPRHPRFTFIDLFAGIGGFRLACQNIGGRCVFSSEWDEDAQKTYSHNFDETPFGDRSFSFSLWWISLPSFFYSWLSERIRRHTRDFVLWRCRHHSAQTSSCRLFGECQESKISW